MSVRTRKVRITLTVVGTKKNLDDLAYELANFFRLSALSLKTLHLEEVDEEIKPASSKYNRD